MSKVYVVMGNDYPKTVFSTDLSAEEFCKRALAKDKAEALRLGDRDYGSPRIYWRWYSFELDGEITS